MTRGSVKEWTEHGVEPEQSALHYVQLEAACGANICLTCVCEFTSFISLPFFHLKAISSENKK